MLKKILPQIKRFYFMYTNQIHHSKNYKLVEVLEVKRFEKANWKVTSFRVKSVAL